MRRPRHHLWIKPPGCHWPPIESGSDSSLEGIGLTQRRSMIALKALESAAWLEKRPRRHRNLQLLQKCDVHKFRFEFSNANLCVGCKYFTWLVTGCCAAHYRRPDVACVGRGPSYNCMVTFVVARWRMLLVITEKSWWLKGRVWMVRLLLLLGRGQGRRSVVAGTEAVPPMRLRLITTRRLLWHWGGGLLKWLGYGTFIAAMKTITAIIFW